MNYPESFLSFFKNLFESKDFMPHGHCYLWRPEIVWLHVVSDGLIALSYYSTAVALIYFIRRRKDVAFSWMFVMFGAFILACGTTHLINIWTLWHPVYRLDGLVKALTAFASLSTAVILWPLIPRALKLPSPAQLEEANVRLKEANRLKSEFLANMSHELRTPLNGIIGFSEFLGDEKPGPLNSKQKECVEDVLQSGRHLLQIINDILDLSKVEAGKIELNIEPFSVPRAVDEVCANLMPMSDEKRILLKKDVDASLEQVTLDPQKFKQVLYNLLSNALKFTNSGGLVQVDVRRNTGNLWLRVQDNGIGIKKEDMSRLFVEFRQLDSSLARQYQGTGLGLALTKKIVEFQKGTVSVESEFGKGSAFTVELPL